VREKSGCGPTPWGRRKLGKSHQETRESDIQGVLKRFKNASDESKRMEEGKGAEIKGGWEGGKTCSKALREISTNEQAGELARREEDTKPIREEVPRFVCNNVRERGSRV